MKFKLIIALVTDEKTDTVIEAGRKAGATGSTTITAASGQGLTPTKTFFGLTLEGQRDVILFLVEEHLSRRILEQIARDGRFEEEPGAGIAFQVDIEDAIGLNHQIETLEKEIEDQI